MSLKEYRRTEVAAVIYNSIAWEHAEPWAQLDGDARDPYEQKADEVIDACDSADPLRRIMSLAYKDYIGSDVGPGDRMKPCADILVSLMKAYEELELQIDK